MRVSSKLSELDELTCHICMEPALPPVYHCRFNHVTCVTCYYDYYYRGVGNKCQICHGGEDNIVSECNVLTSLVTKMEFMCPNFEDGCRMFVTIDRHDEHISLCEHSRVSCPICECGFEEKILLMDHFIDHEPMLVTYGEVTGTNISPGGYLFREQTNGDYFFLLYRDETLSSLSLQHMQWGKKKAYEVYVVYEEDTCEMGYTGQTEVVKRWPEPSKLSLRLPSLLSNRRTILKLTIRDKEL